MCYLLLILLMNNIFPYKTLRYVYYFRPLLIHTSNKCTSESTSSIDVMIRLRYVLLASILPILVVVESQFIVAGSQFVVVESQFVVVGSQLYQPILSTI